ncbi:RagB/SusD family nutrient uptake outer membrane protein [Chitinophaga qingshengii]|uniref:RagB/SusD family nutrient uptake outer membrane protein n=1 Tax=Chitinophaga qingshengii TaxID=1569794 RepID=A0ABR7TG18_9BACT|nr:RagB/SusD family nutrient uptake outer membrane protein [Chitinophaga qingshengii]MBC9928833.1 RagB/SusD family nutrient uptake outer membrane protein [Chitinophaga qingshengii]
MKKNRLLFIAIFAAAILSACNKSFLDTKPTNAVPDDQVFNSVDNASTALTGIWAYMFETYFTFAVPGIKSLDLTSDAMGSDVALTTSYGFRDSYTFIEMTDNTKNRVSAYWTILYKTIDNCNNFLSKIDQVPGDDAKRKLLKGQASALRGWCYLTLAEFYSFGVTTSATGKSVPIYTDPANPATPGKPRSSVTQVYQQAISDLTAALPLLADYQRDATQKFKIDANVANGLLARAYLYSNQPAKAIDPAVAARQGYSLMSGDDYNKGFNDVNNPEWIWGQPQTPNQNVAASTFNFLDVSTPVAYYKSFKADPWFQGYFDSTDVRFRLFQWSTTGPGALLYKKFRFRDPGAQVADVVLMRSAEMYLIEAESYARTANNAKAAEALNALRSVRSSHPYNGGGQVLDSILLERRKELWGEGFSLVDIIRTGGTVVRKPFKNFNGGDSIINVRQPDGSVIPVRGVGHRTLTLPDKSAFVPNSPYYLFAIPLSEIQNNPNLNN